VRTSELAARAAVNPQTLRYYERRGLLAEPVRSPGGYRAYPDGAVRRVRFIKRAQELGFTLAEVETLLDLAEGGPDSCDKVRALATEKITDLRRRIADLRALCYLCEAFGANLRLIEGFLYEVFQDLPHRGVLTPEMLSGFEVHRLGPGRRARGTSAPRVTWHAGGRQ
jgi:DNA-binding transcriptional MerR regulator